MALRRIPCPNCGHLAPATGDNPWRPFCSRRCKLIDLGEWLNEEYRIPDRETGADDLYGLSSRYRILRHQDDLE